MQENSVHLRAIFQVGKILLHSPRYNTKKVACSFPCLEFTAVYQLAVFFSIHLPFPPFHIPIDFGFPHIPCITFFRVIQKKSLVLWLVNQPPPPNVPPPPQTYPPPQKFGLIRGLLNINHWFPLLRPYFWGVRGYVRVGVG